MGSSSEFVFNIAYTVPINDPSTRPEITADEFWRALRRGGPKPHLFAEYVKDTEILPNPKSELEFRRRLKMADGAVHTKSGAIIDQDCRTVENLMTEATTTDTGARSTMLLSHGGRESDSPTDLYLTAIYELHVPDVEPGSEHASEIEKNYSLLAQGAARTVVERIREWKIKGTIDGP